MKILTCRKTINFSKKTFAIAGLAAAISLAGCSSDNPDDGTSLTTTSLPGIAVDGYLVGATVYIDLNEDGRKSAGEPSAITDKDGYFSTSKDGTDYCSDSASKFEKLYCLKTAELGENFVIRTFGGLDLFTGEPFLGSLARNVTPDNGIVANQMMSPLTSLLVGLSDDEKQSLLTFFDLENTDLDTDFLDSTEYDADILNSAIKLHKVVTLFSKVFSEQYDDFGERSFPETPNAIIYKALASRLAASSVLDQTNLTNAFNDAQADIRALYEADEDLTAPSSVSGSSAVQDALDLLGLVDNAIPTSTSFADAKFRVIGVETVVKKMGDGDSDVADAIAEGSNPSSGLYTAISNAFAVDNGDIDFFALTNVNFSDTNINYSDIAVVGGNSFASLANKQLYINLNDNGQTGSGYIFFNSDIGATAGELKLCLRYSDGNNGTSELEETEGLLLKGTWMSINDSKMTLTLAGFQTLSLFDRGMVNTQHRFALSYGGETRSWLSDNGLLDNTESQSVTEQPTNDATCKTLLESNDSI